MTHKNTRAQMSARRGAEEASNFTWRDLEGRFKDVQAKAPGQQKVSAWFTRTESHTGSVTEEWRLMGNPACRVEFEQLASIAARKLGYVLTEPNAYWLNRVREWMIQKKLDKDGELAWLPTGFVDYMGHRATTQNLWTERIAQLSAMLCVDLTIDLVPESVTSLPGAKAATRGPDKVREELRRAAEDMRKKNPHISDLQISKVLEGKTVAHGLSGETIRKKIR